jgi:hypothetical protein
MYTVEEASCHNVINTIASQILGVGHQHMSAMLFFCASEAGYGLQSHLPVFTSLSPEPLLNLLQMTPSSPSSAAALAGTPQQISRELAADSSERASPGRLASTATHKTAKSWSRRGGVSISATYTANGNQETYTPHMIFLAPSRRSGNLAGRSQAKTHSMCWVSIPSWSTR